MLTTPEDQRAKIFARYGHVRRVAWTCRHLLDNLPDAGNLDSDLVDWFAWAHDLNRWPFAHNSERGSFDQASDMLRYLEANNVSAPRGVVLELSDIIAKKHERLGREARLVLLADIITGFIEDPNWLTTTLNISPLIIPEDVRAHLCLPYDDPKFMAKVADIAQDFRPGASLEEFSNHFDSLFTSCMARYVEVQRIADPDILGTSEFTENRHWIKDGFMRKVIFPYNNEKICRGVRIKRDLIGPVLDHFGARAAEALTQLDDEGLVAVAIRLGAVSVETAQSFLPRLDYMNEHEPKNSLSSYMRDPR